VRWTIYPKGHEALSPFSDLREVRTVTWFADGWWIARPHANGAWIGDMRFGEGRTWGEKKGMVDSSLVFSWDLTPDVRGDRLKQMSFGRDGAGEMLMRMGQRMTGNREAWEANPRLAGVKGSLPEFLAVEE
jgi:inner membrane protein